MRNKVDQNEIRCTVACDSPPSLPPYLLNEETFLTGESFEMVLKGFHGLLLVPGSPWKQKRPQPQPRHQGRGARGDSGDCRKHTKRLATNAATSWSPRSSGRRLSLASVPALVFKACGRGISNSIIHSDAQNGRVIAVTDLRQIR